MSAPGMMRLFARELISRRAAPRGPLPGSLLDDATMIEAMRGGGGVDGRTAAGYLYHSAQIVSTCEGARRVVDLGCGTGAQLSQVAALMPGTRFVGVDRSAAMLGEARRDRDAQGHDNIDFLRADITSLDAIADGSVDAVICTMTLHHLPDTAALRRCLAETRRILRPGGAIYFEDFGRLKSPRSMQWFVAQGAPAGSDAFSRLYAASLAAAFRLEELRDAAAAELPADARLYRTFVVPFLVVIKTPQRPLSPAIAARLRALRAALPPERKGDLDDLRTFFRLGGLAYDPFR